MPDPGTIHNAIAAAWNARNYDTMKSLADPEYTFTGPDGVELSGGPETAVNVGQMWANAFPDGKLEVKRVVTQGNIAIAEMVGRGTHRGDFNGIAPTGKTVTVHICNVMELRNGKVFREREYLDVATILQQLGVMPAPAKSAGR